MTDSRNLNQQSSASEVALGAAHGVDLSPKRIHFDLQSAELVEHALTRREGRLASTGALVVDTGQFTGRSPKDKFVVTNAGSEGVDWGSVNQAVSQEHFDRLLADMCAHAAGLELYVQDLAAGADPAYQVSVRVATEYAWHSLFASNLFRRPAPTTEASEWLVLDLPSFEADPKRHGSHSTTAIMLDFERRVVLIANTEYAGEIKKSIFSALNLALPRRGVFPMHCSANKVQKGGVALFFGLSGTGKTTLSADPDRRLIGDDEHGWSDDGVFNFEGGCYAKVVNLSAAAEPEIFAASTRFGTVLENVILGPGREPDYTDISKTENTRAAYPISFIPHASRSGVGRPPSHVVFLSADAFGVLPPIARLTVPQALYHFLSGYTAKVAGTERGVTEPTATFSACFGAPFMPLPPVAYAEMLRKRLEKQGTHVWLLNTGWTGGGYGVGERINLRYTRALVRAALLGVLDNIETYEDEVFGLAVPKRAPAVPEEALHPRGTWADPAAYDAAAARLAAMFRENFARFEATAPADVLAAGPRV
ncbi:MAG: phosphoenolpyruvate carboxykinase (ATP) [Truepera sp.]|jgi:phosphoenolpyruvate carboxykinase (ATP)|nr:phosphoenolpyruvate carboxykinase (ATP) [Truepera sp.]